MANPTWLSLHCLNGMNLLVPFSDTQKYPYDANYIMFVAILRLQGAAPFFLRSCFMGATTSAHHGELLVAWIVEAGIARMRVESEKSRVLYTFFHPLQHPVRQHWACQTYASTYSKMRCGWWGLYICLYWFIGRTADHWSWGALLVQHGSASLATGHECWKLSLEQVDFGRLESAKKLFCSV